MTDQEFVDLLEQGAGPEDFTLAQLELLRARIRASAEVRRALRTQVQFRAALCETLVPVSLPLASILRQAAATPAGPGLSTLFGWGASTLGAILLTTLAVLTTPPDEAQTAAPGDSYQGLEHRLTHVDTAPEVELKPEDNRLDPPHAAPPDFRLQLPAGPLPSPSDEVFPLEAAVPPCENDGPPDTAAAEGDADTPSQDPAPHVESGVP